jgi:hypothetical protein
MRKWRFVPVVPLIHILFTAAATLPIHGHAEGGEPRTVRVALSKSVKWPWLSRPVNAIS